MGNVITFAQQKGGSGKTTLLAHLAVAMARKGKSCKLFDLDPQASLSRWADLNGEEALSLGDTASYRMASDIRAARDGADMVLVDCPGSAAAVLETAIGESDLVIVPCQSGMMDVWATEPIFDMCKAQSVAMRIVLNRLPPRGGDISLAENALGKLGAKMCKARIGNRVAYARSMSEGRTALDLPGQKAAKDEVAAFATEIARTVSKI